MRDICVCARARAAFHCLRGGAQMMPYDVFAMLLEGEAAEVRFLRILRVLKLVRLFRLQSLIVNFEMDYNVNHNTLTLWKFLLAVVYLTHCLACGFIFVTVLEDAPRNWLTEYEHNHASKLTQYTVALYYSAAMASSVGYGPFGAITPAEQVKPSVACQLESSNDYVDAHRELVCLCDCVLSRRMRSSACSLAASLTRSSSRPRSTFSSTWSAT